MRERRFDRRILCLCLCLTVPLAGSARAQTPRDLTPDESVRLGLEHNARLRAADADARAARAAYRQVRAGRLPTIRSQANYTRLSGNIPGVEFTLPGTDSTITFQGVQLDRFHSEVSVEQSVLTGRLRHQIRAAAHETAAAELEAEQERSDVAFEIRRAYWNLSRALSARGSLNTALARVDEHLRDVRNRLQAGAALQRDLLAAQTRRSEVQLEIVEAENAVRVGQLELNRLIGLPLDTPVRPVAQVDVAAPAAALDAPGEDALARRPQLAALGEEVSALRARLRAAQGERLPEVDLVGRYVYARPNQYFFSEQDRFRGTWELGLSTRWDLWEGGRRSARAGEARARLEAAEARLADRRAEVSVDVARQHLGVVRATAAVEAAAQNVRAAEESFRVARQQYEEGAALSADVLDAEQAYRRAQARSAEALADYATARAALLNALGQVW